MVDAASRPQSEALSGAAQSGRRHDSLVADARAMEEVDKLRATGPDFGEPTGEV